MITDKDIIKLKQVFVTKDDIKALRSEVKGDIAALRSEVKGDIAALRSEVKGEITKLKGEVKNDILIFKDQILGEIVKLREESVMDQGIRDQLEDHDIRIEKLEKHTAIAS